LLSLVIAHWAGRHGPMGAGEKHNVGKNWGAAYSATIVKDSDTSFLGLSVVPVYLSRKFIIYAAIL